jgi:hypothetical protein
MKKIILLLATLLSVTFLYAQTVENKQNPNKIPRTNEDFFTQAEFVAEGYFFKCVATYDTKGNGKREDFFAIVEYKIKKVYKGDISLAGNPKKKEKP